MAALIFIIVVHSICSCYRFNTHLAKSIISERNSKEKIAMAIFLRILVRSRRVLWPSLNQFIWSKFAQITNRSVSIVTRPNFHQFCVCTNPHAWVFGFGWSNSLHQKPYSCLLCNCLAFSSPNKSRKLKIIQICMLLNILWFVMVFRSTAHRCTAIEQAVIG